MPHKLGPIGRLGRYTATHFRVVAVGWLLVAVVLGFFAPRVETALSGAGWETTGSQSVQARNLIDKNFHGLSSYALMTVIYSPTATVARSRVQGRGRERRAHVARRHGGRVGRGACAGRLDLARRSHRDRPGRGGEELERDGRRRRQPEGEAAWALDRGGARRSDGRVGDVV